MKQALEFVLIMQQLVWGKIIQEKAKIWVGQSLFIDVMERRLVGKRLSGETRRGMLHRLKKRGVHMLA